MELLRVSLQWFRINERGSGTENRKSMQMREHLILLEVMFIEVEVPLTEKPYNWRT